MKERALLCFFQVNFVVSQIKLFVLLVECDLIKPDLLVNLLYLPFSLFKHLQLIFDLSCFFKIKLFLHFSLIQSLGNYLCQFSISLGFLVLRLLGEKLSLNSVHFFQVLRVLNGLHRVPFGLILSPFGSVEEIALLFLSHLQLKVLLYLRVSLSLLLPS